LLAEASDVLENKEDKDSKPVKAKEADVKQPV
jgi:hypothetical protein